MREGWDLVKLGSLCDIQNGFAFDSKLFNNDGKGLPLIRIRDIKRGYSETFTTEECDNAYVVKDGDYLIGMDGEFNIGQWKSENALLNQRVCKLLPSSKILPRFIYYYIPKALKDIEDKTAYATVKHLSSKQIKEIHIPNISLPEQQRIVDILDREFAKIDALKANAEKSLQVAKDLFRHISNGYYNEPSPVSKLGEECIFVRGPFGGSLKKSCFVPSGYPVYEQQHAIYSTFTFRYFVNEEKYNEMKRFTTHPGDLIMSCSGTIGKVAIIPEDAPIGIINQALLKLTPKKRILPEYLKWYMQSISFEKDIQRHSKGAAIQNVASVAILKEIAIPVPTIEKQKQIVARLDDLNERCNDLQQNYQKTLSLCDDLKQSLLRKAFNGEL